jgi:hypothetical protein
MNRTGIKNTQAKNTKIKNTKNICNWYDIYN